MENLVNIYENGRLSAIKRNDLNMWIIYDDNGPVTLKYGSGTFHYVTNPQGDVVAIVGNQGQKLVEYTYDAWGKVTSITGDYAYNLGVHNPILYRGYIYDHETGMYYCQSRYYDPETGRFLNADAFASTGQGMLGNNMFAYCQNNPVMYYDHTGTRPLLVDPLSPQPMYFGSENDTDNQLDELVDLTDRLNAAMFQHAEELSAYAKTNGGLAAAIYFAEKERGGGDWDLKSQPDWGLVEGEKYIYNGTVVEFDEPGNIHYGFVGRVLFSEEILLVFGGLVQITSRTSSWQYWATCFDEPRDHAAISTGYHLWDGGMQ